MGRTEKSRPSAPTSKPKEADNPGIPDPMERSRPSVRQALKEIREEQKQRVEDRARRMSGGRSRPDIKRRPKRRSKNREAEGAIMYAEL